MVAVKQINDKISYITSKIAGVKKGECYLNIFRVVSIYPEILEEGTKIVLGYTNVTNWGILNRHLWLEDGKGVIDPTYALYGKLDICEYYPVKRMTMAEYIDILCEEDVCADLLGEFKEEELKFHDEIKSDEKLHCINEVDYYSFVHPFLKKIGT